VSVAASVYTKDPKCFSVCEDDAPVRYAAHPYHKCKPASSSPQVRPSIRTVCTCAPGLTGIAKSALSPTCAQEFHSVYVSASFVAD